MSQRFIKIMFAPLALAAAAMISAPAQAHEILSRNGNWSPPAVSVDVSTGHTVMPFCDGKYEDVASGLHQMGSSMSVDFYRLAAGLPKLTGHGEHRGGNGASTREETRLKDALLLLDRSQSHLSKSAIDDYRDSLYANMYGGGALDWWLTAAPGDLDKKQAGCNLVTNQCRRYYQKRKNPGADIARKNTAYDWLLTGHQMDVARTEWLGSGSSRKAQVDNIFDHIDKQSQIRPGINIWMAQYQHHTLFERSVPQDVFKRAEEAISDVISCQATPVEYGILAVGDLGLPRSHLPKGLAESRTRRDIHTLTYKSAMEGIGLDRAYREKLLEMVERLEDKTWSEGFLFLSALDLEMALEIEDSQPISKRRRYYWGRDVYLRPNLQSLLYSLPTEHIPAKYSGMKLGHILSEEKFEYGHVPAMEAYAKSLSKIETELRDAQIKFDRKNYGSQKYKDRLKVEISKLEERVAIYNSFAIQDSDLPSQVKLTLIALMSDASHNIDPHHRDLYPEQTKSNFLDIFLRRTLFPATIYPSLQYGRGYHSVSEKNLNGDYLSGLAYKIPSLRLNNGKPEVGFAALVDWEKLESFGDEKRLTRTLALNIFNWVDSASPETRAQHAHLIAPALYDIIRMCRHEDAGDYKDEPIQKRAFERLHKYYGNTESAKNTPVWWKSRQRHGNAPL